MWEAAPHTGHDECFSRGKHWRRREPSGGRTASAIGSGRFGSLSEALRNLFGHNLLNCAATVNSLPQRFSGANRCGCVNRGLEGAAKTPSLNRLPAAVCGLEQGALFSSANQPAALILITSEAELINCCLYMSSTSNLSKNQIRFFFFSPFPPPFSFLFPLFSFFLFFFFFPLPFLFFFIFFPFSPFFFLLLFLFFFLFFPLLLLRRLEQPTRICVPVDSTEKYCGFFVWVALRRPTNRGAFFSRLPAACNDPVVPAARSVT